MNYMRQRIVNNDMEGGSPTDLGRDSILIGHIGDHFKANRHTISYFYGF